MRLKIPPKTAILQIDSLIKEGAEFLDFISTDYWEQEEKGEQQEKERKQKEAKEYDEKIKNAPPDEQRRLRMIKVIAEPGLMLGSRSKISPEILKNYQTQYDAWFKKTEEILNKIYEDFTPIYSFIHAEIKTKPIGMFPDPPFERFDFIRASLKGKIPVLVSLYKEIQQNIKSPLIYLPEKAQICFYDFMCQLKPETNESDFCKFLFEASIGEWKEYSDAYAYITGENVENQDEWPKNWKKTINSAYDGINLKTNEAFGFPIIKKEKMLIGLQLPTRFIRDMK